MERLAREAEILREKITGLTVERDLAQKKQAETRRRSEELSAMHASDSARLAEILARLVAEESESARLQKLNDALEAKLIDANESAARLTAEARERDRHHQAEKLALREEVKALNDRLQGAANQHREIIAHMNETQARNNELEADRSVLDKKLETLETELGEARRPQGADATETGQMRKQIADLQATVARLKRFENIYLAAKGATKSPPEVASSFTVESGQIVPEFDPGKPAGHA
jgi:chromosome segregation ATPase